MLLLPLILALLCWFCGVPTDTPVQALGVKPTFSKAPPQINGTTMAATASVGDTSTYTVTYWLNKPPRTTANGGPDTVKVTFKRDSTAGVPSITYPTVNRFAQRDSAKFQVPKVYGLTAKFTGCSVLRKNAELARRCYSVTTNWPAKPDTIPPVIDSVVIDTSLAIASVITKPDSVLVTQAMWEAKGIYYRDSLGTLYGKDTLKLAFTCPAGGSLCPQQQFCPLLRFKDGKVAMSAEYQAKAECLTELNKFASTVRAVSPAQQAKADSSCFTWTATGGTVTSSLCGQSTLNTIHSL